jgi:hypothetical protein
MLKLNSFINSIPWYVFGMLIVIGVTNILLNAENSFVVITSIIACGCFTYIIVSKYS